MKVNLLIIDAQQDFCSPNGSLFVPGADKDMERLSTFINRMEDKLDDIHVTLDTHSPMQVFHPAFWVNNKGEHPNPFTVISVDDVKNGVWRAAINNLQESGNLQKKCLEYVEALAKKGKYPLIIWPYHTLLGSIGHALVPSVSDAIIQWEKNNLTSANYILKGNYYLSEAYGALESEVPDPEEPATMLNTNLVKVLSEADEIIIAGEALSHCVRSTALQLSDAFGDNIKRFVLLSDCSSSVTGFEKVGTDFIKDMSGRGMRVTTSIDYK